MLTHLLIKNYALIRQLELQAARELNIITGETGAGKSIMLGAIGLLLGNRADTKALFDQTEKCVIEGTFDISGYEDLAELFEQAEIDYETQCLIRREVSPSGKSRTFINDTPVNLDVLRKIGAQLMDIHSQHDTLQLGSASYQTGIVDSYAQNKTILIQYKKAFEGWKQAETAWQTLISQAAQAQKESAYNQFLLDELLASKLLVGEQEELEQEQNLLENAEDIKLKLNQTLAYLSADEAAITPRLKVVQQLLDKLSSFSSHYKQLSERTQACFAELRDIADEVETEEEKVEIDDERIAFVQERLDVIYGLQKKHGVNTVQELVVIREELDQKVSRFLSLDDNIAAAKKKAEKLQEQLLQLAQKLSSKRQKAIEPMEKEIKNLFKDVGMPNATVRIKLETTDLTPNGAENISLLFTANKGVEPQELKNVASGGEFSRLMLIIKYVLAGKTALPTIVFDEIDTGISGEIAIKVGAMMQQMGRKHQIIAITHLPQIAARGQAHYYVYKDNAGERTVSKIRELNTEERIGEIAQMISGEPPTTTSLNNARELLEMSR